MPEPDDEALMVAAPELPVVPDDPTVPEVPADVPDDELPFPPVVDLPQWIRARERITARYRRMAAPAKAAEHSASRNAQR